MLNNLADKDRFMLLLAIILLIAEFAGVYFLSVTGKSALARRYLAQGGIARAHRTEEKEINGHKKWVYRYSYQNQDYEIVVDSLAASETIEVYFDPRDPQKSVTMTDIPKWRRLLPIVFPAFIMVIMVIAYKVLYG